LNTVSYAVFCREHDDRYFRHCSKSLANFNAIETGKHHVEQYQVWLILFEEVNALIAFVGHGDLITLVAELEFNQSSDVDIIFNDEDFQRTYLAAYCHRFLTSVQSALF